MAIIHKIYIWCKLAAWRAREGLISLAGEHLGLEKERHLQELLWVGIVTMVGLACFGLGVAASRTNAPSALTQVHEGRPYTPLTPQKTEGEGGGGALKTEAPLGARIVASKNSTKYHYLWCKGASRISPKNRRYFTTKEEAQKAGYTLAGNCK